MIVPIKTQNRTISGHLANPDAKNLLIICHGYKNIDEKLEPAGITALLAKLGYGIYNFNPNPSLGGMDLELQTQEISAAVDHFAKKDKNIYLVGGSLGALIASIVAVNNSNVTGIVTLNGFFGKRHVYGTLLGAYTTFRSFVATRPKYNRIWRFYKTAYKPERISQPVLAIHSAVDTSVSIIQSIDFFKHVTSQKDFVMLKYSDHGLSVTEEHETIARAIDTWVNAQ